MTTPVSTSEVVPLIDPSSNSVVLVTAVSSTVISLLQANMKLPTYNLTEEEQTWINLLITNSPQSFVKMDTDIQNMVSLGSIGVQSIPQLIQLCVDILNQAASQQGIANPVNIYILIKFILDVLLQ